MNEFINTLDDAAVLFTFDVNRSYWKVTIVQWDEAETAFKSHHGLNYYIRMHFKL